MPNLQFKYETGMPNDDLYQSTSEALLFGHKFEFAASKNEKQVLQVLAKKILQQKIFIFMSSSNVYNGNAAIFAISLNLLQDLETFSGVSVVVITPACPGLA